MGYWDIGLHHIVDIDGQLLAIDAEVIDTASLLAKANRPADRPLWLIRAGERFLLQAKQLVHLSHDEVLFFVTEEADHARFAMRLAA
jgi:hypothetical protein